MGFLDPKNAPQSTYQASPGQLDLQKYGPAIQQALTNYNATNGRQNELVSMLLSPGGGPNLANAQLQQATQQNNLQAAGAMASTRGLNPALAARQILDTQAAQNQAAAGQSSINRLAQTQQSRELAANVLGQQQSANAAMYGTGAGANNAQNQQLVAQQGINAETANHNADIQNQAYKRQADFWSGVIGGGLQAAGSVAGLGALGLVGGGGGGGGGAAAGGGSSYNWGSAAPGTPWGVTPPPSSSGSEGRLGLPSFAGGGEVYQMLAGGSVPGRAPVAGNSPRNDVVPAMLSPGEVVIPRTIAQDPEAAADFIRAMKARRKGS